MQQFDASIFHLINHGMGSPALDGVFLLISYFGLSFMSIGISLIMILIGIIKYSTLTRVTGYAAIVAVILAGLFSQVAKHMWDRPRPLMVLHDVRWVGEPLFVHSFPSGHTTTAFAFACVVSSMYPKTTWFVYSGAVLVGLSRVYLGVHYPMDVLCGAVLGVLSGKLAVFILKRKTRLSEATPNTEAAG